jgi:hypothetical protein
MTQEQQIKDLLERVRVLELEKWEKENPIEYSIGDVVTLKGKLYIVTEHIKELAGLKYALVGYLHPQVVEKCKANLLTKGEIKYNLEELCEMLRQYFEDNKNGYINYSCNNGLTIQRTKP